MTIECEWAKSQGSAELGPMESAFPTAGRFVRSLEEDNERCLSELGWRKKLMGIRGTQYTFFSRDALAVAVDALETATDVRIAGDRSRRTADAPVMRSETMNSDVFLDAEEDVLRDHHHLGNSFTLAMQLYSDNALLSWSGGSFLATRSSRI